MKSVIGIDFGTDSVRALVIQAENGKELGSHVSYYPRWKMGMYCDASRNQWRQHPLDYIECMQEAVIAALKIAGAVDHQVIGIGIDTTGSTPIAVNRQGIPLSLLKEFQDNPNAMFVLWKDHTGTQEADEINELCRTWHTDYTRYEGGIYSSEWFWAKILKIYREDELVYKNAYSWVEHCDWIPFVLTGGDDANAIKRSRCAAGHKALWHPSWNGLPDSDFLKKLDPKLDGLRERLFRETYTADQSAGKLCKAWAENLGLSTDVVVAVGAFDAHMGAVGGEIEPYYLSKVMGTSTCDILVAPKSGEEKLVKGICGQVDGSVIPGMLGLEAGQSAFGDLYAWFHNVLGYSLTDVLSKSERIDQATRQSLIEEGMEKIIAQLSIDAEKVPVGSNGVLTLDWLNGRRTPDANQKLKGVISGLNLGSLAPQIFRSIVEASCYGAKIIVDRFIEEGIPIRGLIGLGGVAKKSPFIMQTMSDIMNMPIKIVRSDQTCALGAAMFAATAAGAYHDVSEAMKAMGSGFDTIYTPNASNALRYNDYYQKYKALANRMEPLYS